MKEELENYNKYKLQIVQIDKAIRNEINKEAKISGSNFEINGDIRPTGYMTNNIENQIINKSDRIMELEEQKKDLELKIEIIDRALATLKSTDRQAIEMRFFQKLEYNEISAALGIVKIEQKISNAIKKLENNILIV